MRETRDLKSWRPDPDAPADWVLARLLVAQPVAPYRVYDTEVRVGVAHLQLRAVARTGKEDAQWSVEDLLAETGCERFDPDAVLAKE